MTTMKTQIATNLDTLNDGVAQIRNKFDSSSLTNEERQVFLLKLSIVKMIFDFLKVMKDTSEKQAALITLCMRGGRCTSKDMRELDFRTLDHMRYLRSQMETLLEATVLNTDKVNRLFETNSLAEVMEIKNWYVMNVLQNKQLLCFIAQN
ncbi:hypothetical protein [Paenibacillus sp. EPM92]|uniref:hypothetical protein n=1 Tax=Paenibacillus sp. EPM92 TaxID=1561195 RepID=UPI001914EE94|nr:hypothetical protein [Paenibacillus sp. EPM92]